MPERLWKVSFIGGPKDGETRKMVMAGTGYQFVGETPQRRRILHCYTFDNPDLKRKTMDAVYAGTKKYV